MSSAVPLCCCLYLSILHVIFSINLRCNLVLPGFCKHPPHPLTTTTEADLCCKESTRHSKGSTLVVCSAHPFARSSSWCPKQETLLFNPHWAAGAVGFGANAQKKRRMWEKDRSQCEGRRNCDQICFYANPVSSIFCELQLPVSNWKVSQKYLTKLLFQTVANEEDRRQCTGSNCEPSYGERDPLTVQ